MSAHGESPLLSIAEVAMMLNKKYEAARIQLNSWRVPILKIGKANYVTRFDFDVALGIVHAGALKLEYPWCWQERYKLSQTNPAVVELVFKEMGALTTAPTTKVRAQTESDNKLINKLKSQT